MLMPPRVVFLVNGSVFVVYIALGFGGGSGLRGTALNCHHVSNKGGLHNNPRIGSRLGDLGGLSGSADDLLNDDAVVGRGSVLVGGGWLGLRVGGRLGLRVGGRLGGCGSSNNGGRFGGRGGCRGDGADACAAVSIGILRAEDDDGVGGGTALGGGEVVAWNVVRRGAEVGAGRASNAPAPRVGGDNGNTILGEGVSVNVAQIIPKAVAGQGVLELSDVGAGGVAAHFDGNTAAVGVDAVGFSVLPTLGGEGLHRAVGIGNGPDVNIKGALIVDNGVAKSRDLTGGGKQHSCAREECRSNHFVRVVENGVPFNLSKLGISEKGLIRDVLLSGLICIKGGKKSARIGSDEMLARTLDVRIGKGASGELD